MKTLTRSLKQAEKEYGKKIHIPEKTEYVAIVEDQTGKRKLIIRLK